MLRGALLLSALLVPSACSRPPTPPPTVAPTPTPATTPDPPPQSETTSARVSKTIGMLELLLATPTDGDEQPRTQRMVALCEEAGALQDTAAVPVLLRILEAPADRHPVVVFRAAIDALGHLRDPRAVDALLTVSFRVPDAPSTTSVSLRAQTALARIGEPAVPRTLALLRGEHAEAEAFARDNGVPTAVLTMSAAGFLGAIGSSTAVPDLLERLPTDDCKDPSAPASPEQRQLRARLADTLGRIADPRAVEPLCSCTSSAEPLDLYPTLDALGRIGGPSAAACLTTVVRTGEYSTEVVTPAFRYEPRWEAARLAILAAAPDDLGDITRAMASARNPRVRDELKAWDPGVNTVTRCGRDRDCYQTVLQDDDAPAFARETAAAALARLAPEDPQVATAIARAYTVRDPDARITMASLPARMMNGTACPTCAQALRAVLEEDRATGLPMQYQRAVLVARDAIARLEAD